MVASILCGHINRTFETGNVLPSFRIWALHPFMFHTFYLVEEKKIQHSSNLYPFYYAEKPSGSEKTGEISLSCPFNTASPKTYLDSTAVEISPQNF